MRRFALLALLVAGCGNITLVPDPAAELEAGDAGAGVLDGGVLLADAFGVRGEGGAEQDGAVDDARARVDAGVQEHEEHDAGVAGDGGESDAGVVPPGCTPGALYSGPNGLTPCPN